MFGVIVVAVLSCAFAQDISFALPTMAPDMPMSTERADRPYGVYVNQTSTTMVSHMNQTVPANSSIFVNVSTTAANQNTTTTKFNVIKTTSLMPSEILNNKTTEMPTPMPNVTTSAPSTTKVPSSAASAIPLVLVTSLCLLPIATFR